MGFSFTVTQALLIRELLVSFSGQDEHPKGGGG